METLQPHQGPGSQSWWKRKVCMGQWRSHFIRYPQVHATHATSLHPLVHPQGREIKRVGEGCVETGIETEWRRDICYIVSASVLLCLHEAYVLPLMQRTPIYSVPLLCAWSHSQAVSAPQHRQGKYEERSLHPAGFWKKKIKNPEFCRVQWMETSSTCHTWPDQRNPMQIKTVSGMAEIWLEFLSTLDVLLPLYAVKKPCVTPCEVIQTLTRPSSWFQMLSAGCVCWKCVLWSTATLFPLLQVLLVCRLTCGGSRGTYVKHRKSKRDNPFTVKIWIAGKEDIHLFFFFSPRAVPVMMALAWHWVL